MRETAVDVGTIIIIFSEQANFGKSCSGIAFRFYEDGVLPLDSLVTEFFILLQTVNASRYLIRMSTVTTIAESDVRTSDEIIRKHKDVHKTFTLRLKLTSLGLEI